MASVFGKTILGVVAALVASGSAIAQDVNQLFQEGVQALRLNKQEEALQKFAEVLKLNPAKEDAFRLWRETDAAIWRNLVLEGGELQKIAEHLMGLAAVARKELSADEAAIQPLVDQATTPGAAAFETRSKATRTLAADHGEYAVPALVAKLGNTDDNDAQNYAILALNQLGRKAVLPLIQALGMDNALARRNVAATLKLIGDMRAAGALAQVAAADASNDVRMAALSALESLRLNEGAADSVKLNLAQAQAYLTRGIRTGEESSAVWTLNKETQKLEHATVPGLLMPFELAKQHAFAALAQAPGHDGAEAMVARACLAEATTLADSLAANPENEALKAVADKVEPLRMVALATGPTALRDAVADALRDGQIPVAVAGIHALGESESRGTLAQSSLVALLDHSDKRVRYASSLALSKAAGAGPVPAADKVVANLGEAVGEESLRVIRVIDPSQDARNVAVQSAAGKRGSFVEASAKITDAAGELMQFPTVDVVVINEVQTDGLPETLIALIRGDERMKDVKILVIAENAEKATERFGDRINGTIQGPLAGEALMTAVNTALEGVAIDAKRARADEVAIAASNALRSLGERNVDLKPALASLAAQLNRADTVALPAAAAIGDGGAAGDLAALVAAIKSDASSLELKVACAEAAGKILGRNGETPADVYTEMMTVVTSDADIKVRRAVVTALGKGKLAPGDSLKLLEALKVAPGARATDEG